MKSIIRDLAKTKGEYAVLMAYAVAMGDAMYERDFLAQAELVLAEYRELPND